ncbi:MAG: MBL fold metallo-hydrolase [Oscillospiraceae bacterium]|nr:MBL fold metallo-hydrolase [Oscillospiraceae bacterium]
MAKFYPLFSSSKANASYIGNQNSGILIDAGASCKKILESLACNHLTPKSIQGIFITHTHSDHIKGLKTLLNKLHVPVYASETTLEILIQQGKIPAHIKTIAIHSEIISCGNCEIKAFPTMHDAEGSCGYQIHTSDDKYCAVCTDLGIVTPEVRQALCGCDMILLEANYEPDMLWQGAYPIEIKRRIASEYGHLSNQDSAEFANDLIRSGTTRLLLGHLSPNNNTPDLAVSAVINFLQEFQLNIDYLLGVAPVETQGGAVIF